MFISNVTLSHNITHARTHTHWLSQKSTTNTFSSHLSFSLSFGALSPWHHITSRACAHLHRRVRTRYTSAKDEWALTFTSNVNGIELGSARVPLHVASKYKCTKIRYLHRIYLPLLLKIPSVYNTMKRTEKNQIEQKKGCETSKRKETKRKETKRNEGRRIEKKNTSKLLYLFAVKHTHTASISTHITCSCVSSCVSLFLFVYVLAFMRVFFTMCCVSPTQQDAHLSVCAWVCCMFCK